MAIFCSNRTVSLISTGQAIRLDQVSFLGINTYNSQYFVEDNAFSYDLTDLLASSISKVVKEFVPDKGFYEVCCDTSNRMKMTVIWDVTLFSLIEIDWHL
jgi:hypothetical protein